MKYFTAIAIATLLAITATIPALADEFWPDDNDRAPDTHDSATGSR